MYCICCKKDKVTPLSHKETSETEEEMIWLNEVSDRPDGGTYRRTVDNMMISDGIIHRISAGYGSIHDTDTFIIAICDECITKELEEANLLYAGNYMYPDDKYTEETVEKSKRNYRRRKNLDGLT